MGKKQMLFTTKGMNQDLSVSKFNPEFSFENINLRLSTNLSNTLLSWVNEKGTAPITLVKWDSEENDVSIATTITGTPIGTAIINNLLVLFIHNNNEDSYKDYIYVLKYKETSTNNSMLCKELFHGDLGFNTLFPLETLVSYESKSILKVYWVDGIHLARFINIVADTNKYYTNGNPINTSFDFLQEILLNESIEIVKSYGIANCEFPAGIIQYAFTYYNKYGLETAVFRTTPLQYITFKDRGGSLEEKINVAFKILAKDLDTNFDYLRIYSIIRTSINSTIVKRVLDIPLKKYTSSTELSLIYTDTNTIGEIIDPTYLLYKGGTDYIIPRTLELKDNTLFLGNLTSQINLNLINPDIKKNILTSTGVSENSPIITKLVTLVLDERPFLKVNVGETTWINTLCCPENITYTRTNSPAYYEGAATFKIREYYRLGILFQNVYGKWSEPCWIGDTLWIKSTDENGIDHYGVMSNYYVDLQSNDLAYSGSEQVAVLALPEFRYNISKEILESLWKEGYRRMRAVYALPTNNDRTILCQGVLNSTLYRNKDRLEEVAYALSSWLFRAPVDYTKYNGFLDKESKGNGGAVAYTGTLPSMFYWRYEVRDKEEDKHEGVWYNDDTNEYSNDYVTKNYYIPEWDPFVEEWKHGNLNTDRVWMPYYRSTEIMGWYDEDNIYRIDSLFCTLHSPDIELSDYFSNSDIAHTHLKQVGHSQLTSTFGDINITTSSDSIKPKKGFKHNIVKTIGTSALISGNFYEDHIVMRTENGDYVPMNRDSSRSFLWPVFMWHENKSLNNDVNRDNQSAKLETKIIGNYRFSSSNSFISPVDVTHLGIEYYGFTEATQVVKVNNHIYKGCVDTVILPSDYCDYYIVGLLTENNSLDNGLWDSIDGNIDDLNQWDPVFTDLPVIKIHGNDILKPKHKFYGWLIQYDDNSDDWITKKKMPNYNDKVNDNGTTTNEHYPNFLGGYRWNALGGDSSINLQTGEHVNPIGYDVIGYYDVGLSYHKSTVPIKYKSTPHVAVLLNSSLTSELESLPIVEIYRDYNKDTLYGGTSKEVLQSLTWIPCGPIVNIDTKNQSIVPYKWGDTYYLRYECLKTYPYTFEDVNLVVEIGSFMLETRENLDGRYDKNRGYSNILNTHPLNFNLINPVYSLLDNFFNYRIMPEDLYNEVSFPNQITWTLSKQNGADVDAWTNITSANILDLDGDKGKLNKLLRFNDKLLAFQDTGISLILYNENTQISTTEGVPIEIANSGKVLGKRYFTNTVGCSNKWSMVTTINGIYFMDSNERSIYLFNGQLNNISALAGFNTWAKNNIPSSSYKWTPIEFNNFVTYYDRLNLDILWINRDKVLAFSEKLNTFTSFYDYGNTPYFCNLEDTGIWIDKNGLLWKHNAGNYCKFFGINKSYSMTLVGNPEPLTDKIFTNLEFRASIENIEGNSSIPFDTLEAWNEYLKGISNLSIKDGSGAMQHDLKDGSAHLNRKFRIWRCDIPRDNDTSDGRIPHRMDRMRNPWIYLKLQKKEEKDTNKALPKIEIHDVIMTYFN